MADWVALEPTITPNTFRSLESRLKQQDLRSMWADAGLRYRVQQGRVQLRADLGDSRPLLNLRSLQTGSGTFRADASKILAGSRMVAPLNIQLQEAVPKFLSQAGAGPTDLNYWGQFQLALLSSSDPLSMLKQLATELGNRKDTEGKADLRLWLIASTDKFIKRLMVWRMLDQLLDGIAPSAMTFGSQRQDNGLMTGLLEFTPAPLVCAPLIAHFQPWAIVLFMPNGTQVVGVLREGNFIRGLYMPTWPAGYGHPALRGTGEGTYKSSVKRFPAGAGATLLEEMTKGANELLEYVTDPAQWQTSNGELDDDERWVAWSSIRFGLQAVGAMGEEWKSSSTVWNAFRAMGTLQGIWEGTHQGSVPLRELLDPRRVRAYAIDTFPVPQYRQWAEDIVTNYEQAIKEAFPNDTLDTALPKIEELRHLLHGTGGQGRRRRDARIATLRALSRVNVPIQLIADLATFWWMAVLLNPSRNYRAGRTPW